jgi:hypothetical protein
VNIKSKSFVEHHEHPSATLTHPDYPIRERGPANAAVRAQLVEDDDDE